MKRKTKLSVAEGKRLRSEHRTDARILMLTILPDDDGILESIRDAVGYPPRIMSTPALLAAIGESTAAGAPTLPEVAHRIVTGARTQGPPPPATAALTPQELRVLQLLADGYAYDSAGQQMGISVNTVRTYIRSVYEKLHVTTKAAAVSRALRAGLIR